MTSTTPARNRVLGLRNPVPMRQLIAHLCITILAGGAIIALTPNVAATAVCTGSNQTEDFEGYATFFRPNYPEISTCFYSFPAAQAGYVVSSPVSTGTRAFYTNGGLDQFFITYPANPCFVNTGQPAGTYGGQTYRFDFDFRTPSTAPSGTVNTGNSAYVSGVALGQTGASGLSVNGQSAGLMFSNNMIPAAWARWNGGAQNTVRQEMPGAPALAFNTYYTGFFVVQCPQITLPGPSISVAGSLTAGITIGGTDYGTNIGSTNWNSNFGISPMLHYVNHDVGGAGNPIFTAHTGYIDNLAASPLEGTGSKLSFCAVADEDNFGFDYKEDVDFVSTNTVGISLDDYYAFNEDAGGSSYLGKGFNPGSKSFSMLGRIEAGDDSQTSVFRFAYTTGSTILTAGSAGDNAADQTAAGNGIDSGNFANQVQLELTEDGDDWIGRIRYTDGGGITTIGPSVLMGNPNNPSFFNFTVDSTNGPTGTGDGAAWVRDGDGNLLMSRNLPAGLLDETWKDAWFIAKAGAGVGVFATDAALDNNDVGDASGSTCIYDLLGTSTTTGSSGSEPGGESPPGSSSTSTSCNSILCTDSATVPEGFTVAAFNGFLGLLLMVAITVGGVQAVGANGSSRGIGLVVAVFGVVGYLVALYFGLLPLWPIVVAAIIAAAIVFMRMKTGA